MSPEKQSSLDEIRRKAEIMARQKPFILPRSNDHKQTAIVHELHVHQIELEIQNEELRNIQADLERSRGKYSDLFNNAPVAYLIVDGSGFILESNRTFEDMAGAEPGHLIGTPFSNCLTEPSRQIFFGQFKTFFKHPESNRITVQLKRRRGEGVHLSVCGSRAHHKYAGASGETPLDCIRIVAVDISEQVAAEKELAEAHDTLSLRHEIAEIMLKTADEEMFAAVLDRLCEHFRSRYGYFGYLDDEGNLVCPSMTRDIFPQCEVKEKSIVFPKSVWGGMWGDSLETKQSIRKNSGLTLPYGHIPLSNALAVPIVMQERLIGQIVLAETAEGYLPTDQRKLEAVAHWIAPVLDARLQRDLHQVQRIQAEKNLRQAQRMESIGVLAGSIAHDFNNILSPIIGYAEMMLGDVADTSAYRHPLKQIVKAGLRAKDLVGQLLAFGRKQMLRTRLLDVNQCVKNASGMFARLIREDVTVTYRLDPDVGPIKADPGQIDQILLNLVANAQDAMPGGGSLTLETGTLHLTAPMAIDRFAVPAGRYTRIAVKDTGEGIDAEVRPFIFEPFFTTKIVGQGTGMGLATCYGIVKQHGGYIWAEGEPGGGTCFSVLVPVAVDTDEPPVADHVTDTAPQRSRGETIMVVEDEAAVRKMATLALKRMGYHVIEMDSPERCLEKVAADGVDFDLLLSDVIMPGCNGKELYDKIRPQNPRMKVLFMSGYTDDVVSGKGILDDGIHLISKPFTIDELGRKVRAVLDDRPRPAASDAAGKGDGKQP